MSALEFFAAVAWPIVALIALLILGPGGVLQKSIGELASKLMSIKSSVDEFKIISEQFNERQRSINESLGWLAKAESELSRISSSLDFVRTNTNEILLSQGEKQISDVVGDVEGDGAGISDDAVSEQASELTAQQRYDDISSEWQKLTESIRQRIGPERYDGRAIGDMAWKLSHQKRKDPLSKQDAELVGTLHSQYKRFARMHATKEDWLTQEIYENFMRGLDKALAALT